MLVDRVKLALTTARSVARIAWRTDLRETFRPRALARFARDLVERGDRGVVLLLRLHADADPDRPAIVDGNRRLTYGQLDAEVCRVAHGLAALGVGPRDRVAVMLPNRSEYIVTSSALAYVGGIVVQVGYRLKGPEIAYIIKNSQTKAFVFAKEYVEAVKAALAETPSLDASRCFAVDDAPGFPSFASLGEGADASRPPRQPWFADVGRGGIMVYTSGTTGKPKGARRDFKDTKFETMLNFMAELPFGKDERHLVVCPLYHSAAPALATLTMAGGGCIFLEEHFDPAHVLDVLERERITSSLMVPTMLHRLVELGPDAIRRRDLSSLRWLLSGAAPLPTELARRVEDAFGPVLWNFYGATETGVVTVARPGEHTARPGTIGRLVSGNEVRILDADGRDVRDGEVGELWVRSGFLMQGYHADEKATRAASRDGFVSVGDLAWRDGDGYYFLADRKSDMIISGGVNVYPLEIEQRLHEHPAVAEAAVVGAPDPAWGESIAAFVVVRAGRQVSDEELREWVTATLADFKKPRRVVFVDALPRNPTGKVLKRELRAQLTVQGAPRREA